MRQRDYITKAEQRIVRFTNEADARILRTIQSTIQRLEREKLEYQLRMKKRRR